MTRIDELKGSEGQRCVVIDWRDETRRRLGVVERWVEESGRVIVHLDEGKRLAIPFPYVDLLRKRP